jgi:ligand-binding sensor domain-containing protein/serine phosphatase RsbU (regulator of sigma subunit)
MSDLSQGTVRFLNRNLFPLFVLFLLLPSFQSSAQTTSFINYGVEQGLSQSQVQTITQDDEGNLWIGTLAGLTKYNGRSFTTFSKKNGMAEDWVTASYKAKSGDLWFGHWAGGVTRYNSKTKRFEDMNLEEYTRFKTVTTIMEDAKGYFWIGTEGSGVFIYDPAKNKMFALSKKDGLVSNNIYRLATDHLGNIWIATDMGITLYDPKLDISSKGSFSILNTANGLNSDKVTALACVNSNEMWVGTADGGVMMIPVPDDFSQKSPAQGLRGKTFTYSLTNGLKSNFVQVIYEDSFKNVWIGTISGGATKIIPFKTAIRTEALHKAIVKTYSTKQGLNYFNVNSIFQDRESNVWIGTDIGLNQYRGDRFVLLDQADGISNNIIWSTLCDQEGNLWLGTNDGLSKVTFSSDPTNNEEKFKITNFSGRDGLSSNVILATFQDSRGNLWFGTGFGGVCELEKGQSRFKTLNTSNGLASDVVYAINEDNKGNLWFGTKEGVSKYEPESKSFRNFTTADGLGGNYVYRIFKDSKSNLWFGALGGNLSVYDGSSFMKYDETNGIDHRFILAMNEDKDHNIWFGSYGGGLFRFDGKAFTNYTTKDGMMTDSPYSIIADNDNNIWIGHSRGIDKFDRITNRFLHYGKSEGFLGVETNPNATCKDKKGNIWFGTIMGVVRFSPAEDKPNIVAPRIFISGLKVFMKDMDFPLNSKFTYNQNHITFVFTGISLTNPEKVLYQYKLDGFDKDWSPVAQNVNEAVYSNVPPGTYTFQVKASNNDGLWSPVPASYSFTVKPPFWQTISFYIAIALFSLFGIYVFDLIRTRNLKEAKKKLQTMVEERTLELAVKNNELAEKNKDITDSIRYAKRIQETLMPSIKEVRKELPDSFIMYRPKDIVSGDFIFLRALTRNDEKIVQIAAIDCTGHGVPGAFMSIVAHNMLASAVEVDSQSSPAEILDRLNKGMSERMHKSVVEYRIKDGMDIAFCTINLSTMIMEFSGAYNPVYVVRNKIISEYKGDKVSIGSYFENKDKKYTNSRIELQQNDSIYLFSDGYVDQFGGPTGKKYKSNQLKQFLVTIQHLDMEDQRESLEKNIESWRGNLEQVDDILMLGIRI